MVLEDEVRVLPGMVPRHQSDGATDQPIPSGLGRLNTRRVRFAQLTEMIATTAATQVSKRKWFHRVVDGLIDET